MKTISSELKRLESEHDWLIEEIARFDSGVWQVEAAQGEALSYPEQGNSSCAGVEDESFWFAYRNRVIEKLLRRFAENFALWDIGGGNGFVSRYLTQRGRQSVVVEPGVAGATKSAERQLPAVICGRLEQLSLPEASLQAVGAFDVIEHLEKPEEMLQELHRVLQTSGVLVVTVPAFPFLWSQSDEFAGHQTRFTRSSLARLMAENGFEEVRTGYFMSLLVAPVYLLRVIPFRRGRRLSEEEMINQLKCNGKSLLSQILELLLYIESIFIPNLSMPVGTSVYGVFRPKSKSESAPKGQG